MNPQERKAEIVRELQTLDAEHPGRQLPPEAVNRWRELERELETVEGQIDAEVAAP